MKNWKIEMTNEWMNEDWRNAWTHKWIIEYIKWLLNKWMNEKITVNNWTTWQK